MEKSKEVRIGEIIINVILFVFTTGIITVSGYIAGQGNLFTLKCFVISFVDAVLSIYTLEKMRMYEDFLPNNDKRQKVFLLLYLFLLLLVLGSKYINPLYFPISAVVVLAMMYSGFNMGISALITVATGVYLHSGSSCFIYIFICGFVALLIFEKITKPLLYIKKSIIVTALSVALIVVLLIFDGKPFSAKLFMAPAIGCLINFITMVITLRHYSKYIVEAFDDIYDVINDPEHELLTELKNANKAEYSCAIHAAYLCDKIAEKAKLNRMLAKGLGYYHRIGAVQNENVKQKTIELAKNYNFPLELTDSIEAYQKVKNVSPVQSEVVLCVLAVDIINSIRYVVKNDKNQNEIDYDKIIDFVFKKRMDYGLFEGCEMSVADVKKLQEMFKGEKQYYDFLR